MIGLFDTIAREGSPDAKVALLKSYPYQESLKKVLYWALDPFITFGITDFPDPLGPIPSNVPVDHVLQKLSTRELSGGSAREALSNCLSGLSKGDWELYRRVIRKDLRCGLGEQLALRAYPGLIRQFKVMRAAKIEPLKKGRYFIEPKYDGLRGASIVRGGSAEILSRNGNPFTTCEHIKPSLVKLASKVGGEVVFDGELVKGNFNSSSSSVRKKEVQDDGIVYYIFDFMTMDEWNNPTRTYDQRRNDLESLFQDLPGIALSPRYPISSDAEAYQHYNRFRDLGYEGGMVKKSTGLYRKSRHKDWMKIKAVNDVDLKVEDLIQGEGKYYGMLGAAVVRYKGKRVNVGSGWSDEERDLYWKYPNLLKGKVIEIQYHEVTPDGSLRHPRFIRIREDKSPGDLD